MFTPHDFLAYRRQHLPWEDFAAPAAVIIFYQGWFLHQIVDREKQAGRLVGSQPSFFLHVIEHQGVRIGLAGGFGIGSPAVAAVVEELIALGATKFISVGTAGALQKDLAIGSLVVCTRAIRDEGVSHHYAKPSKYAHCSPLLTRRLQDALAHLGAPAQSGTSWSIDTPYRETTEEMQRYQAEGVLTVEMEASALASVAHCRKVDFAAGFAISDSLADLAWEPHFRSRAVAAGLEKLYAAALQVLL
jgi:uridine phosphorylase